MYINAGVAFLCCHSPKALGIGAASFAKRSDNGASKDIAESPTAELYAETERPNKDNSQRTTDNRFWVY